MLYPSLIERLKYQHMVIPEILSSLSADKLDLQPGSGKWSLHDHIVHLVTYQPVYIGRIQQILAEDRPSFGRYVADVDQNFINSRHKPVSELLADLIKERNVIVELILSLKETALQRTGSHLKYGNLTILQWTEFFLLHEAHHLFTMFQLAHT